MKTRIKSIFTSLPFIVGVFIVVYAGFGMVYYQKHSESQEIEARMTPTRIILDKPAPDLEEMEEKLGEVEAVLEAEWASFPDSKQGIELYNALVDVATKNNVEVVSISASQPIKANHGSIDYGILPYNVSLMGSQNGILSLVSSLAEGSELLHSSEINNVNISNSTSSNTTDDTTATRATIQLYIYVRSN